MADDAATILAPPDPTWNPPPTAPPDAMVAAQNTAPVQPPSNEVQAISPAPMTAMVPSETAPNNPDVERQYHESTWRRILDKVGSILGGDQTLHVTKDADGNIKMTHDPSTGGEKWGRIAAAALGGAAQGLANSQGPGGAARAAAAGTQYGLQLPKQMREEADAQATAEQKRMMDNANNALIHQRGYLTMLESQGKKLQLDSESAALMNAYRDEMANSPESKDFGVITGPQDLVDKANQNQDFLKNHINYRTKSALVPGKNGFELHAIATDPGDDAQPVGEGAVLHVIKTDPETGKPRLTSEPVSKGSRKTGELRVVNSAIDVQFAGLMNNYNKTLIDRDKADREKIPTTQEAAVIDKYRRLYPNDPAKAMDSAAKEIQAGKKELRSITNINMPGGANTYSEIGADLYNGKLDISQLRARKDWPQIYAAAKQHGIDTGGKPFDPAMATAKFGAIKDAYKDYSAAGDTGQKIQGFSTLLEHLGDMSDNADELRSTRSPWLNRPINALDQAIMGGTKVGPAELRTQAPAHEFANVLSNNHALSDDEKKQAAKNLNVHMTPAQIQENGKQMAKTSIERLAPVFQAFRETTNGEESPTQLTPRAIRTLKSMGLYDYAMKELHGAALSPAGAGGAPQPNPNPDFDRAKVQPPNPPFAGAVFGTGAKGQGWYLPQTGGK